MNIKQIQELAGHRTVSPWVVKLIQDCIKCEQENIRPKCDVCGSKLGMKIILCACHKEPTNPPHKVGRESTVNIIEAAVLDEREKIPKDFVKACEVLVQEKNEAVLAEREACAKVCEEISELNEHEELIAEACAAAIRARGEK